MIEEGTAGQQLNGLLSGVDQVFVFLTRKCFKPSTYHAILTLQEDLVFSVDIVGHHRRKTNAEIEAMLSTKATLTEEQREAIRNLGTVYEADGAMTEEGTAQ